ncbi:hypothetical protein BDQ17DRAFT_1354359 [Cyathus striatus]|nr:hypothetical protein BDQ17DRAFT_1354359 [Cyathus striatus]
MTLPKLTSLSTKTLSLLLEWERLQTLQDIGVGENGGQAEAVKLLKNQFERMRGMVGVDIGIESLEPQQPANLVATSSVDSSSLPPIPPVPPVSLEPVSSPSPTNGSSDEVFTPYTDDPDTDVEPGIMLQTQRRLMDEQDVHLDHLSNSIRRQHHISLQINDELDTHTGLLSDLDNDLDRTSGRLSGARRRLDRFAKGAKENGSTVTIALLILVLLILIIIFKT